MSGNPTPSIRVAQNRRFFPIAPTIRLRMAGNPVFSILARPTPISPSINFPQTKLFSGSIGIFGIPQSLGEELRFPIITRIMTKTQTMTPTPSTAETAKEFPDLKARFYINFGSRLPQTKMCRPEVWTAACPLFASRSWTLSAPRKLSGTDV